MKKRNLLLSENEVEFPVKVVEDRIIKKIWSIGREADAN